MLTLSIEGKSIIYIHLHGHMQHAQVASEYISDAMRVAAELIVKVGEIITKIKGKLNCWWPNVGANSCAYTIISKNIHIYKCAVCVYNN